MLDSFFPLGYAHYLAGGLLLGAAMSLLFVSTGLVMGMSTVLTSTWSYFSRVPFFREERFLSARHVRLVFAAGLVIGAAAWALTTTAGLAPTSVPAWQLAAGGFIAGFGARHSNGCTSGHGICGIASLQPPSILAVITFLATAMITANLLWALR